MFYFAPFLNYETWYFIMYSAFNVIVIGCGLALCKFHVNEWIYSFAKMTAFAGWNILIIRKNRKLHCNMLQHLQPSSLGAIVLYCVGEVQSTGSAGGSTSQRTAGGGEQRLTNSAGATRGCVMLYLETRHLCPLLHSEPQWCTYQTAERRKFTLSRREEKDSLFKWDNLMEWISRGNVEKENYKEDVFEKYRAGQEETTTKNCLWDRRTIHKM